MPISDNRRKNVVQYCVRLLNNEVFDKIRFKSRQERDILYDSYLQNIDELARYAMTKKIEIAEYFKEIRAILLESDSIHERAR